jgi:hypothetical protein
MKYYLLNRENQYREFESVEHLLYCLSGSFYNIGHNWNDSYVELSYFADWKTQKRIHLVEYIIYDEYWRVTSLEFLKEINEVFDANKYVSPYRREFLKKRIKIFEFRSEPVPKTGKRKFRKKRYGHLKSSRYESEKRYWNNKLHNIVKFYK